MTQTGTRRFCFPAFKRRIFFAAGLFFDMSSTFSDSPDGRIAAALGLRGQQHLQLLVGDGRGELACGVLLRQVRFDRVGSIGVDKCNACKPGPCFRCEDRSHLDVEVGLMFGFLTSLFLGSQLLHGLLLHLLLKFLKAACAQGFNAGVTSVVHHTGHRVHSNQYLLKPG